MDDADALRALRGFSTMAYWKARSRIVGYIRNCYEQGRLQGEDRRLAISILEQILTDGKLGKRTPTARRGQKLLSLLEAMEQPSTQITSKMEATNERITD